MTYLWIGVLIGLGFLWILGINALLWWLLARRFRRQSSCLSEEIAASGETLLAEPARGLYQGGGDYISLRTQGVAALTDRRIIFRQPVGSDIEIPLSQIVGITQNTWFKGNYHDGRDFLILKLADGKELAFMVREQDKWVREITARTSRT